MPLQGLTLKFFQHLPEGQVLRPIYLPENISTCPNVGDLFVQTALPNNPNLIYRHYMCILHKVGIYSKMPASKNSGKSGIAVFCQINAHA